MISAHWLLAAGFIGMAVAIFWLGWASRIMWREWKDDRALRAAEVRYERASERHTHRKCGRDETVLLELPQSGRLEVEQPADLEPLPAPPWLFAGESSQGWAAESAEYELLTQTTEQPAVGSLEWTAGKVAEVEADERLTSTGEMRALVDTWIAKWEGDGNYLRHTMRAD